MVDAVIVGNEPAPGSAVSWSAILAGTAAETARRVGMMLSFWRRRRCWPAPSPRASPPGKAAPSATAG